MKNAATANSMAQIQYGSKLNAKLIGHTPQRYPYVIKTNTYYSTKNRPFFYVTKIFQFTVMLLFL